jgi:hypothetical protein
MVQSFDLVSFIIIAGLVFITVHFLGLLAMSIVSTISSSSRSRPFGFDFHLIFPVVLSERVR